MIVSVRVERVTLDTASNRFVVILRDDAYKRWLPIVVGPAEAQAIALQMENVQPPRPMTHDLIKNILNELDIKITKVVVTKLQDNTYYAKIEMEKNNKKIEIDARPSDAIAIALRKDTSIFVEDEVLEKAAIQDEIIHSESNKKQELNELNKELQTAVKEERYEDAAKIRDKINELKKKPNSQKK